METKETYEVMIAGFSYRLRSSHPETTVAQMVQLVEQKIHESLAATKSGSIQNAAVLAALNLAEELVIIKNQARQEICRLESQLLDWQSELAAIKLSTSRKDASK